MNLELELQQLGSDGPVVVEMEEVEDLDRQEKVGKEAVDLLLLLVMTPLTCREAGLSYGVSEELRALHQDQISFVN